MFASRVARVRPFEVMEILGRARAMERAGRDIIHLEVGEPDFATAEPIRIAACEAIGRGDTHYTEACGTPELRAAISRVYSERAAAEVVADRILVTAGATGALLLLFGALLETGDELLVPDPCYPCYGNLAELVGASIRHVASRRGLAGVPDVDAVQRAWGPRSRGIVLASPANPTGAVIPDRDLHALIDWVEGRGGFVIVDEIYQGLRYDTAADRNWQSILASRPGAWVVNSFSKYFGMTGWRVGWLVAPEGQAAAIEPLAQNWFIAPSTPGQAAALAALHADLWPVHAARRDIFARRRATFLAGLDRLGLAVDASPDGAFYVWVNTRSTGLSADRFVERALLECGVACTPGRDFGPGSAACNVRFAFTQREERLDEAIKRLQGMLGT